MDVCLLKCSAQYLMVSIALLRKTCQVNRRQITNPYSSQQSIPALHTHFYAPHKVQYTQNDTFSIKHIKLHGPNQIRNVKKEILIVIILFDTMSLLE